MGVLDEQRRLSAERRRQLEEAVPGKGVLAWIDRGAWAAMAQESPAVWSWPRALITVGAGLALAVVIYVTVLQSPAFLIGLAIAYAVLLARARSVHDRYGASASRR